MHRILRAAPVAALIMAMPAAAWTTIDLFPNIGPPSKTANGVYDPGFDPTPSLFVYGNNAVGAMLDGELTRGGSLATTPDAFNTSPDYKINYRDIIATEFPSYRGNMFPTGVFGGEKGNVWRVGVRIESSTPFTLDQFNTSYDYPYGTFAGSLADLLLYSYPEGGFAPSLAVGIYYGADGVRGTVDDVVCDSLTCDPMTQQLNLLAWRGRGFGDQWTLDDLNSLYGGDKRALLEDERLWFSGYYGGYDYPFRINQRFTLTDDAGAVLADKESLGVVTGVPEPASWAMLVAGFGLVGATMRRRAARAMATIAAD
jgi:hypothetical protein